MKARWTKNRKSWNLILEASCEAQEDEGSFSEIHQEEHDILTLILSKRKETPVYLGENWINDFLGHVYFIYSTISHISP